MTKKQTTVITFLSVAAIILALMLSGRFWFRIDLTKNRAYTISAVSRNLHLEIPEPVNVTFYISDKLKTITAIPGEIEDTLREYTAYSRGKIRLTVRDPVKAGVASMIEELGLQPRQIQNIEQDQASFSTVYSGITIEYLNKMEILPWVISTETLEYDLTSRIRNLVNDTERLLGVLVGDSFREWNTDFSYLNAILTGAGYRIRQFYPGEEIPDNLPALFVLGGAEELDEWALYRIDRYIQMGGRVLFAVKGIYVDTYYGSIEARNQYDLGLINMISYYGIAILPELALDHSSNIIQYQSMTSSGGVQYRMSRYPLWISVHPSNGNARHPVSAGFTGLDLYWASPLELYYLPDLETSVLFTSSEEAWSMRNYLYTNPDSYLLEIEAADTKGTKILGASLSGYVPGFYAGYQKPVREGSDEELPDMPLNASPSRIVVIGDVDFATNMISSTQDIQYGEYYNLDFILRIADWLSNDDDIIGIRNRQPQAGRLDKIQDADKKASAMKFAQTANIGVFPVLIIAAGLYIAFRRRANERSAENRPAKEKEDSQAVNASGSSEESGGHNDI